MAISSCQPEPMVRRFLLFFAWCSPLLAAPGIVWHEPAYPQPEIGGITMRYPAYEPLSGPVTVHQGFAKAGGANGNQTGGAVFFRFTPRGGSPGAWESVALGFSLDAPSGNQYWQADLPFDTAGVTDVIEYYIRVDFDGVTGSNPETTYLHGGDLQGNAATTATEEDARADPFSIRNRPGWIYHAGNRSVAGDDLQVRLKSGYIGPDNDPATRWATLGAVYFTTDGSDPVGTLGAASGTTTAVALNFDGSEEDGSGNGNAALWRATLPGVLGDLPFGGQVKYRIGLWNPDTGEEKFADHVAGADNEVFVFQNGNAGDPVLTINGLNANYTTTKLFVDEIAGETEPLAIVFEPGDPDVEVAEVYTNLNRRDRAALDADGDGYPDGISGEDGNNLVAGDDGHYYKVHPMVDQGGGVWTLDLDAARTGAYRLTARWKVEGETGWRWYTNAAANRRDHAITVSPRDARDIRLYEINILNIEASGDTFGQRSTIEDLHNASGAPHNGSNRWDLDYLLGLGCNWLWFQPIHPAGIDGREPTGGYGSATPIYDPGSPYAVKNFFAVNPLMTKDFAGSSTNPADLGSAANRAAAMNAWTDFVDAADAKGVGLMLDAPFNHTAFDVEVGEPGLEILQPDGGGWSAGDEIRDVEARFFSSTGDYSSRASGSGNIAAAPDRFDFGKWNDVKDVHFGRYDALVEGDYEPERSSHTNEGDWFDATDPDWTADDIVQGGEPRNVTRRVWQYFARYATFWIEQNRPPGEARNSSTEDGLTPAERYAWDGRGIDGLRCDFGQGLPPQCWEYVINVARSVKWNFVMMSESLDGGAVTYRSNRHFDILNENIVFPLKTAGDKWAYRGIFEDRRNAYGQGLVLLNSTSHDEENYDDPWQALVRYSVSASIDGVPMIFPGQELGISRTTGYDHYEINFGKTIPHFKRYNSMMPAWNDTNFGNDQLYPVYAAMNMARALSPALRSSNRWFLDGEGSNSRIHAVAKYETAGLNPATQDVVLAFANLDRDNDQGDRFRIPPTLADLLGLQDGRIYNVRNLAAYTEQQANRRDLWLWDGGISGADLESAGFGVELVSVPTTDDGWNDEPFEAQYLKLHDVTAPAAMPSTPLAPGPHDYFVGDAVWFDWDDLGADAGGVVPLYEVEVSVNGSTTGTLVVGDSQFVVEASGGDEVSIRVRAVNPEVIGNAGPWSDPSATIALLPPNGDADGDGQSNASEAVAMTDALDPASVFRVRAIEIVGSDVEVRFRSVPGMSYQLRTSLSPDGGWGDAGPVVVATGGTTLARHPGGGAEGRRFYRVEVVGGP